jgi:hypothetical protein
MTNGSLPAAARTSAPGRARREDARGDRRRLNSGDEVAVLTGSQVIRRLIDEVFDVLVDGASSPPGTRRSGPPASSMVASSAKARGSRLRCC